MSVKRTAHRHTEPAASGAGDDEAGARVEMRGAIAKVDVQRQLVEVLGGVLGGLVGQGREEARRTSVAWASPCSAAVSRVPGSGQVLSTAGGPRAHHVADQAA